MGREARIRKQKAVYWARSGVNDDGEVTLAAYDELYVQWVARKAEMQDAQGNTVSVDVQAVVGSEVTVGSIMAHGAYDEYSSGNLLYEVVAYDEQRDLQNRAIRRVAGLRRYGTELPDLAS